MGGRGSGQWYRWDKKDTTESNHRIDIRWLKKQGWLFTGACGSLSWSCNGRQTGSIRYRIEEYQMVLNYRHRRYGGEWENVDQHVFFDSTPCNYGGHRYWFLCPRCFRRVAVIFGAGKHFLCRHCYGLTYSSQQESWPYRMMRKSNKIKERLGEKPGASLTLCRPKGMHRKTYYKLSGLAMKYDHAGWVGMARMLRIKV